MIPQPQPPAERPASPVAAQDWALCVSTYQRGKLLCDCVRAALASTERPAEIVIVDSGSTDGTLALIDYKTGQPPRPAEVESGHAPQLPLEALIAGRGGFPGIAAAPVSELAYWRLSGGEPPGEIARPARDIEAVTEAARDGLERLIQAYDDPATPYLSRPDPDSAPRYSDYLHLARVKEWSGTGGEDGA